MFKKIMALSFILTIFQAQASEKLDAVVENLWDTEIAIREKAAQIVDEIVNEDNPFLRPMIIEQLLRENRDLYKQVKKLEQKS